MLSCFTELFQTVPCLFPFRLFTDLVQTERWPRIVDGCLIEFSYNKNSVN